MGIGATGSFIVKDQDRGWKQLRRALETLRHGDSYAKAGIIGERSQQEHDDPENTGQKLSNVDLGLIQEFGSADGRIPARSFIREPFDANRETYIAMTTKFVAGVYAGKMEIAQGLGIVAQKMASDMREAIAQGIPPPNAPSTIAQKGSSKPLIDSGQLRQAVSGAVVLHGQDADVVNIADKS